MKPLAITLGDPAGIGAEVVLKAIAAVDVAVVLFGDRNYASQSRSLPRGATFVDVGESAGNIRFGEIDAEYGRIALRSIDAAVEAVRLGQCSALVTSPIHKQSIAAAGSEFPGHTELLAARAGLRRYAYDYAMYLDSPSIRTVLLTVHLPLRAAIDAVDASAIAALAALTNREYRRLYGASPRMAVAGINPHAGEGGRFGAEEEVIARGVAMARERGLDVAGPFAADTLFLAARAGTYDVIVSMYHDQGLIAVKTLEFNRAVNVTLGLPYLRCSVDHGTAFDIAGKDAADPEPMRYAIEWAAKYAERWKA
ncbi:MAG TPA: 4-hydroxythreonine-4-phosphate dehydrogenase PdxA [Thermoanaerobaculia bacterium]|nr:4-hydroxythreonine-4-phosphate dehydrogenase PdxA [Thermoanaerobaculia bacterium]